MYSKNKICVFGYNFKHWKTQNGIINLIVSGYKPDYVILQNWKQLNIPDPTIRNTPKDLFLYDPEILLNKFNIPFTVCDHNSHESEKLLEEQKFELGIILGSRILSEKIIDKFKKGILNLHPGLLPENRGLDTIKWAITRGIKQGVTSHLIDKNIDRGLLILKEDVKVYQDDSLLDLHIRIQNLEQKIMIESLKIIFDNNTNNFSLIENGIYNCSMSKIQEEEMINIFSSYKQKYGQGR